MEWGDLDHDPGAGDPDSADDGEGDYDDAAEEQGAAAAPGAGGDRVTEPERLSTRSVARDVAEADPIVLRQTAQVRLVFLPTIHEHAEHPLRGEFVWQRKRKHDEWDDVRGESLGRLKSGEGFVLELHSAEVTALMTGLLDLEDLYRHHGIVFGTQEFVQKSTLPRMVQEILDAPRSELAAALEALDEEALLNFARRIDLSKLDTLLEKWEQIRASTDEDDWQDLFAEHAWMFSQLTGSPVVVLQEKAYVGGKSIENTGGGQVDFLLRNALTDNVVFVEIKTPHTKIVGSEYRSSGSFEMHREVSGGLVQVLGYKDTFEKEYYDLAAKSPKAMHSYNPRCFLIIGSMSSLNEAERRCFDLFRNALTGAQILTFDEVEERVRGIREALTEG